MIDKTVLIIQCIDENLREVPENLNNYIGDETGKYKQRFELDDIKKFIDEFINQNSRKRLIVLPGIRGVGKTTLLYQTYEYLLKQKNISPSQILYTSCDDLNDITECSIRELTEIYLEEYHNTTIRTLNKKIFLLIDEAQYDKNWGLSSKILYDKSKNIFILITGSSALELKVSADVERRSTTHEILPLTYPHYLKLKYNIQIENNDELMINTFLTGNIDELKEKELQIKDTLINNINYTSMDWKNYIY
ncbi:MAG: AAA family ATPase, partial [Methanosphaera sp.]|nr:AAA family ATPase [Methanosphaera sp.]